MDSSVADRDSLGESSVFLQFQESLSRVSKVNRPVLFIGERGTGKELAASRLHYLSKRWQNPFLALNCAALPENLIESELFGYAPGAFTGASKMRKGRFEEADGGTLFLDEMGLIPMSVQEKILRVVEYGSFERVGSSESIEVNVRLIGATNANLVELCEKGLFKHDLLDRLSFEVLFLPPLRKRGRDIMLLAHHFAARMAYEIERPVPHFSSEVEKKLTNWKWPGNIRELKNTIERAVYRSQSDCIDEIQLNPFENPYDEKKDIHDNILLSSDDLGSFKSVIKKVEIDFIKKALVKSNGNQKIAAQLLNISYDSFRGLYRKYNNSLA